MAKQINKEFPSDQSSEEHDIPLNPLTIILREYVERKKEYNKQ